MNTKTTTQARKAIQAGKERAIEALRNAIKDCATCSEAQAITCTECEARYLTTLRESNTKPTE